MQCVLLFGLARPSRFLADGLSKERGRFLIKLMDYEVNGVRPKVRLKKTIQKVMLWTLVVGGG